MPEYKEISRTSDDIERIRLNSDCNLNLVSFLIWLQRMLQFSLLWLLEFNTSFHLSFVKYDYSIDKDVIAIDFLNFLAVV